MVHGFQDCCITLSYLVFVLRHGFLSFFDLSYKRPFGAILVNEISLDMMNLEGLRFGHLVKDLLGFFAGVLINLHNREVRKSLYDINIE